MRWAMVCTMRQDPGVMPAVSSARAWQKRRAAAAAVSGLAIGHRSSATVRRSAAGGRGFSSPESQPKEGLNSPSGRAALEVATGGIGNVPAAAPARKGT